MGRNVYKFCLNIQKFANKIRATFYWKKERNRIKVICKVRKFCPKLNVTGVEIYKTNTRLIVVDYSRRRQPDARLNLIQKQNKQNISC